MHLCQGGRVKPAVMLLISCLHKSMTAARLLSACGHPNLFWRAKPAVMPMISCLHKSMTAARLLSACGHLNLLWRAKPAVMAKV